MQALHLLGGGRVLGYKEGISAGPPSRWWWWENTGGHGCPLTGVMILESNRLMGGTWMVPPASDIISRRTSSSEG